MHGKCRRIRRRIHVIDRNARRVGDKQCLAVTVLDGLDQVRADLVTAVCKSGPAGSDFHRGQCGRTECQRQVAWQVLFGKTEAGDVVDGAVDAQRLKQADRNQVA